MKAVETMDPPAQLRATAKANITKILAMRLRMAEDDRNHPEIAAQDVGAPLVVCGLPRTGTTITYDLLCLDPAEVRERLAPYYERFGHLLAPAPQPAR